MAGVNVFVPEDVITDGSATYGTVTWDSMPSNETVDPTTYISLFSNYASMVDGGTLTY